MIEPVGHADFYPNGGARQPGCGLDLLGSCSHNRAWQYFAESISSNSFVGINCGSWDNLISANCVGARAVMGGFKSLDKRYETWNKKYLPLLSVIFYVLLQCQRIVLFGN